MSTAGFDHVSMPTADPERLIAFYRRLDFEVDDQPWRGGNSPTFSIRVGDQKINVHPPGFEPRKGLKGPTATPGCTDVCFVWDGSVADCVRMLQEAGVEIIDGPLAGKGARRGVSAVHLYARDPDQNLLEWMIYEGV